MALRFPHPPAFDVGRVCEYIASVKAKEAERARSGVEKQLEEVRQEQLRNEERSKLVKEVKQQVHPLFKEVEEEVAKTVKDQLGHELRSVITDMRNTIGELRQQLKEHQHRHERKRR